MVRLVRSGILDKRKDLLHGSLVPRPLRAYRRLGLILVITGWTGAMIVAEAETDNAATGTTAAAPEAKTDGRVSTLNVADLTEYASQSEAVRRLIDQGLALTRLNLSYKYGSSDPKNGGLDCSGTVYFLLRQAGIPDVPRDSSEMYAWVWKQGRFQAVTSQNASTFELERLKPGDLLFWTGTYQIDRDPPITHVMIYLGTRKENGHRVMLGASEGRTFDGVSRYGVSVFDFKMPGVKTKMEGGMAASSGPKLESRFIGYGAVPGLEDARSLESSAKPAAAP